MRFSRDYSKERKAPCRARSFGFTLLEILIVIIIVVVMTTLVGTRFGVVRHWEEDGFLRRFSETVSFLFHQAVIDRTFYRITFHFSENDEVDFYQVEELPAITSDQVSLAEAGVGALSGELAQILSPSFAAEGSAFPPTQFPSMGEPVKVPSGARFHQIKTPSGTISSEQAYMVFSPGGWADPTVLQISLSEGRPVTIIVNPSTGLTSIYRDFRDF